VCFAKGRWPAWRRSARGWILSIKTTNLPTTIIRSRRSSPLLCSIPWFAWDWRNPRAYPCVFDISPRVIDHLHRARERARKNTGYVERLPRDVGRPWPPELIAYWRSLGDQVGTPVTPIRPPELFLGLEIRAVQVRP